MAEYFELGTVRPVRPVRRGQGPGARGEGRRRRPGAAPTDDPAPAQDSPPAKDPPAEDGPGPGRGKGGRVDEYV